MLVADVAFMGAAVVNDLSKPAWVFEYDPFAKQCNSRYVFFCHDLFRVTNLALKFT